MAGVVVAVIIDDGKVVVETGTVGIGLGMSLPSPRSSHHRQPMGEQKPSISVTRKITYTE